MCGVPGGRGRGFGWDDAAYGVSIAYGVPSRRRVVDVHHGVVDGPHRSVVSIAASCRRCPRDNSCGGVYVFGGMGGLVYLKPSRTPVYPPYGAP